MTAYWLAQGVGVIAFLIGITTFFNRDERRFKKQLSVYSAVIGVHFFLLGTYPAGASAILNAIRTLITLRTRSLWVMAIFIVLTGGIGLAKFHHPVELLRKRLARTVLIFTERSDQLSRATDRVPGLPASPGYAQ